MMRATDRTPRPLIFDQAYPARSIENLQEHVTRLALQLDSLAVRLSALENRLGYNGDQS